VYPIENSTEISIESENSASGMTYIASDEALDSTHTHSS